MEIDMALRNGALLLTIILSPCLSSYRTRTEKTNIFIVSSGREIKVEERCGPSAMPAKAAVIFLHGSGGPRSQNLPYLDEVEDLAKQGYCTYVVHYLDATKGSADNPKRSYPAWVQAVESTARYITENKQVPIGRVALVGYSLGASIALAAAATDPRYGAVVEFSGSLPDEYVALFNTPPPLLILHGQNDTSIPPINATELAELCTLRRRVFEVHVFPGEGHFFSLAAIITSKHEVEHFLNEKIGKEIAIGKGAKFPSCGCSFT